MRLKLEKKTIVTFETIRMQIISLRGILIESLITIGNLGNLLCVTVGYIYFIHLLKLWKYLACDSLQHE